MAATFSYAQAAKAPAPIPKSTPHTPPTTADTFSELQSNGNWADDVESTTEDKSSHPQVSHETPTKPVLLRDVAVERAKSESGPTQTSSDVSSPDMAASASTIPDDLSSNPPCASSDSTWDAKSQVSEPAWIAERKERQGHEGTARSSKKGSKEPSPAPTPRKLQDAPPPAVNPWAKRAEDAKVKTPSPAATPQNVMSAPTSNTLPDGKEGLVSRNGQPKKADPSTQGVMVEGKKTNGPNGLRIHDSRANARQSARPTLDEAARGAENTPPSRHAQREVKNAAPLPPSTDQSLWPTPDTVQDRKPKEATASAEKAEGDAPDADASQGVKAPKKTWQHLPVTPNILWQTPEMNRPPRGVGEKTGRSSNATRARGAFRGGANGPKGGDRNSTKTSPEKESSPRGRQALADREAMPPPPSKPMRTQSAGLPRDQNARSTYEPKTHAPSTAAKGHNAVAGQSMAANTQPLQTTSVSEAIFSNGQTPAKVAPFVPGAGAGLTHAKETGENVGTARETPSHRSNPGEGKKDTRPYDNFGKEWSGPHRGGKRGGRGRGGGREFPNGHQPSAPYPANYTEFAPAGPYGLPPSPSGFPPSRAGNPYAHPQQGRGGWSRSGQRAQSIPVDSNYAARYGTYPQMHPAQGFVPPPFEQYAYGVPAVPYPDPQYVAQMVATQIEYYFSTENLIKDMFLRRNMDGRGFVFLETIANFNRIKHLSIDKDLLRAACLRSESVEIRIGDDNIERLRRREGWEQYVLPVEQREANARTDGPAQLHQLEPAQHSAMNFGGPPLGVSQSRRSYDSGFVPMSMLQSPLSPFSPMLESSYAATPNGEELRGRTPKSPMRDAGIASPNAAVGGMAEEEDGEPDAYADELMGVLTVVVNKPDDPRVPTRAAFRTFSNGSIDPRAVFGTDGEKASGDRERSASKDGPSTNGDDGTRNASRPRLGRSPDKDASTSDISLFWVKDEDMPGPRLPGGSAHEPYLQLRLKALDQREHAATGQCPYDLDVLYQFWSHFLIRNFNSKMYHEFKCLAHDDAKQRGSLTGILNLLQFYAKALASTNPVRDRILKDYVQLVKNEPAGLEGQAYKQLRSAWRNGALNLKHRKKLTDMVDGGLRERLES